MPKSDLTLHLGGVALSEAQAQVIETGLQIDLGKVELPWTTKTAQAFPLDLLDIDAAPADAESLEWTARRVTAFFRRRGDFRDGFPDVFIESRFETRARSRTATLLEELQELRKPIELGVQGWTAPDPDDGGLRLPMSLRHRREVSNEFFSASARFGGGVYGSQGDDGLGVVLRARSLTHFMLTSVAILLAANLPVRRCDHCKSHFAREHPKACYCSDFCRRAAQSRRHRMKKREAAEFPLTKKSNRRGRPRLIKGRV